MNDKIKLIYGVLWGIVSKVISSLAKFVTIPLLVGYYGKADYGLIALSFSLNAYLRLMDLGLNIGAVRYFSIWYASNDYNSIKKVAQSSTVFYGVIGILNAILLLVCSLFPHYLFKLSDPQLPIFRFMLVILAFSSVSNWISNVANQLLTAANEQAWINKVTTSCSILESCCAIACVSLRLNLEVYFVLYIFSTILIFPLNLYKFKTISNELWEYFKPKWDFKAFKVVFSYSIIIFLMGFFQFSATSLRPLVLGKFSNSGVSILTDYRVVDTVSSLVITFSGVFIQSLLPSLTKLYSEGNVKEVEALILNSTKYISIFVCLVIFGLIINAEEILLLYMGKSYVHLEKTLVIWLLSYLGMHTGPVSSLILSSGKTKPIALMAAISCIISLFVTAFLTPSYGIMSAAIGFMVYHYMQLCFYYFYYNKNVLKLDSLAIFKTFFNYLLLSLLCWIIVLLFNNLVQIKSGILKIAFQSVLFSVLYFSLIFGFFIKKNEIVYIKKKILKLN